MSAFPNRCQHLKINGTQCGSPALRRNRFCFFHKRFQDEQIKLSADRARRGVATFTLPLLEDANSIQMALMQVMRLLISQQLDHKTASLLLYALQTASANLRLTDFKPFRHEVVLNPRDAASTPLGEDAWSDDDFEEEEEQEEETAADRAIAALEAQQKKEKEDAKWMRWAELQYPNPSKPTAPTTPAKVAPAAPGAPPLAGIATTPGAPLLAGVARSGDLPATPPKKPSTSTRAEQVRAEISDMVRKDLIPALKEKFPQKKAT
jgi:hypothetical protein